MPEMQLAACSLSMKNRFARDSLNLSLTKKIIKAIPSGTMLMPLDIPIYIPKNRQAAKVTCIYSTIVFSMIYSVTSIVSN